MGKRIERVEVPSVIFVIFGGAGDLTWRKLIPSLFDLQRDGRMPAQFAIVAVDRIPMRDEALHKRLRNGVKKFARKRKLKSADWNHFARHISYQQADFKDPATYSTLATNCGRVPTASRVPASRLFAHATPSGTGPVC